MFVKDKAKTFIHPDDIAKPASEQRSITVRTKLSQGQRAAFWDEIGILNKANNGIISDDHYNLLLLAHTVTSWVDPGPDGVPFGENLIADLDPNDPLVLAVIEYVVEANRRKESPDPKSETAAEPTISSDDGTTSLMVA